MSNRPNPVTEYPPLPAEEMARDVEYRLRRETDCADVHFALRGDPPGLVLLDVRGPALYAAGHLPGALNLPHREMSEARMAEWPRETLFVVYCAGPHCNGADRAALRLARLGRPVKTMPGGVTGWVDEGFTLVI